MRDAPTTCRSRSAAVLLLLALALGGCASAEPAPVVAPEPETKLLPIFYATNRNDSRAANPAERYGTEPAALSYGRADIAIPVDHKVGMVEGSSWGIAADTKSEAEFGIAAVATLAPPEFIAGLAEQARLGGGDAVLVYVHGYNNSFTDALQRCAQLAADLDWQGPAVVFSWPSHAALLDFENDRENADASAAPLRIFLGMLANRADAGHIDVLAHSMGARVLLQALSGFANPRRPFEEIVFAALEMSRDEYRMLAPRAVAAARRVTVYASGADMPLQVIAGLVADEPAGDASAGIVLVPGIDSIDASAVGGDLLGHSYLGDSRAVLADLYQLLVHNLPPEQRFGLRERTAEGGRYWELKP